MNASAGLDLLVSGVVLLAGIFIIERVGATWPAGIPQPRIGAAADPAARASVGQGLHGMRVIRRRRGGIERAQRVHPSEAAGLRGCDY